MIVCVLAAGYATRLYPLTENFPKPLLRVGEHTILDWLLNDIDAGGGVNGYVIVSNHRYADHFEQWAKQKRLSAPITVIDDGSTANENRLGAVRDIDQAICRAHVDDDLMVIAGDNVLDFSLTCLTDYFRRHNAACVMRYEEHDKVRLRKSGVASVDASDRIVRMEEKPQEPFDVNCVPPFYIYPRRDLHFVSEALADNVNADAPGSMIAWLSAHTPVYAMPMPGRRYDIGNLQSYEAAQREYLGISR